MNSHVSSTSVTDADGSLVACGRSELAVLGARFSSTLGLCEWNAYVKSDVSIKMNIDGYILLAIRTTRMLTPDINIHSTAQRLAAPQMILSLVRKCNVHQPFNQEEAKVSEQNTSFEPTRK